ncbi:MAG: N-acetylglucosamine-6-phosphate deacetylase [Eubacteriales bacterium]|nr:N-acetylglucosamine-6-phosphate deacetylase [Eubacteriales bacterium]
MIIQSRRVWVLNTWLEARIEFSETDGKIIGICPRRPAGSEEEILDFGDLRIVPGFIDVHTHGGFGFDTNDADEEGLRGWAKSLVLEGVTGFLPTTITQSEEILTAALRNVAKVALGSARDVEAVDYEGAGILGVHLEGPWLDRAFKGAHKEQYCAEPDAEQFRRFQEAAGGLIRIVTMACEHDKDRALTRWMAEQGIVVSLGHSSASYEEAAMAFANGARSVTHVYNGMAPFHHRDPGIVGAAMRFRNVFGEIICDCVHSAPTALNDYFTAKGPDYGVLITDSIRVKGLPVGTTSRFGGNLIELCPDGVARLVSGSGCIAGSVLKVNEGLRNLVEKAEVPWQTAINACTINPARLIGLERSKGSLQAGKDADIVVLREDYTVEAVYVRGKRYV